MKPSSVELIKIHCGACDKIMKPKWTEIEIDENSCPGCDGSHGQITCLCGGSNSYLQFQCSECDYVGNIEYL